MNPDSANPAHDLRTVREALLRREAAVSELADRLQCVPRILAAQNALLGRPLGEHDLADVVQDTMLVVLEKLPEYNGTGMLEAWAFRICRYELMNALRRRRRHATVADLGDGEHADGAATREWSRMVERDAIETALGRIGGAEAEALRLRHFEGLSFDDMATRLGTTAATMRGRYYRGLQRLEGIAASQHRKEEGVDGNTG